MAEVFFFLISEMCRYKTNAESNYKFESVKMYSYKAKKYT